MSIEQNKTTDELLRDIAVNVHATQNLVPVLFNRVERLEKEYDALNPTAIKIDIATLREIVNELKYAALQREIQAVEDRRTNKTAIYMVAAAVMTTIISSILTVWATYHK